MQGGGRNRMIQQQIARLLAPFGVEDFGVCRFEDCLPLLNTRSAARVPEGARSVILCLIPYYIGEYPRRNVARYAIPNDYHRVAGGILSALAAGLLEQYPGERFVPFVDSSPLREVSAAQLAGLGAPGCNGQLISRKWGCHAFIGEVVTTLELAPATPVGDLCTGCGACYAACPTGALAPVGPFDRALCRSRITQKKGTLTEWEQRQVEDGGFAWGCDLCTDACPLNTKALSPVRALHDAPEAVLTPENLDRLLEQKAYGWRGRSVLSRNLLFLLGKKK